MNRFTLFLCHNCQCSTPRTPTLRFQKLSTWILVILSNATVASASALQNYPATSAGSVVTQLTRYNATVHCCVHPLLSSVRLFHCCRGVIVVRMRNVQRGCDDVVWCRVSVCLSAHIDPLSLRAVTHGAAVRLRAVTSRGHLLRHNTTQHTDETRCRVDRRRS